MKKLQPYCVNEKYTIKEAVSVIQNNLSRCVIVLNDNQKVVGVFSEGDVLRAILQDVDMYAPLKNQIKPSFVYLSKRDIPKAYELVKKYGITLIPIVDCDYYLKDIITIFDIMDHLAYINEAK